jgi:hypothetical protein
MIEWTEKNKIHLIRPSNGLKKIKISPFDDQMRSKLMNSPISTIECLSEGRNRVKRSSKKAKTWENNSKSFEMVAILGFWVGNAGKRPGSIHLISKRQAIPALLPAERPFSGPS